MGKHIKVEGVAFNLADPDQVKLWQHAKRRTNFSAYIKRLIQRDMEGAANPQPSVQATSGDFDAEGFI